MDCIMCSKRPQNSLALIEGSGLPNNLALIPRLDLIVLSASGGVGFQTYKHTVWGTYYSSVSQLRH